MYKSNLRTISPLLLAIAFFTNAALGENAVETQARFNSLDTMASAIVKEGTLVGIQYAIGGKNGLIHKGAMGIIHPGSTHPVDGETMFCIGSCSKPFASACMMSLSADGLVALDTPIDKYLPDFSHPVIVGDQQAKRAATTRELLCHRAGIYSQKKKITPPQANLLYRSFSNTLAQNVAAMAKFELIFEPGTDYAYSGAGYCVLGRVAEVVADKDFNTLLQERICTPLGLKRTAYFPKGDANVADGAIAPAKGGTSTAPHHLGDKHRMTLIGGSLYSTAREMGIFCQMILNQGRFGPHQVLSEHALQEMTARQANNANYSLGWSVTRNEDSDKPIALRHGGSLFTYRSLIAIDLVKNTYCTLNYTLAKTGRTGPSAKAGQRLQAAIIEAMN